MCFFINNLIKLFKKSNTLRKDVGRKSFCYILCNSTNIKKPKLIKTINSSETATAHVEDFKVFLDSIFYVGKGTGGRSHSHLEECSKLLLDAIDCEMDHTTDKIHKILSLWHSDSTILVLQAYHCSNIYEAHNRESAMIATLGINNLTNVRNAPRYGDIVNWENAKIKNYGLCILYQFFLDYRSCPIKPIREIDVQRIKQKKMMPRNPSCKKCSYHCN